MQEFWNGHPQDFFVYRDVFEEKQKEKQLEKDYYCWLQGLYDLFALNQVLQFKNPKKIYPKEAFTLAEQKKNMSLKDKALEWIERVNRKIDKGA